MARIRTIKPEFFDDEDLAKLSYLARIAFVGLWTQADKEGRLEDRPARLRVRLFPYEEDVDMDAVLSELADANFVQRYVVNDRPIVQIRTFVKHQRPHPKEPASTLEPVPAGYKNCEPRKNTASPGTIPDVSGPSKVELGMEGDLGGGEGTTPQAPPPLELTKGQVRGAVQDLIAMWNRDIPSMLSKVSTDLQRSAESLVIEALRARPSLSWWQARINQLRASLFLTGRKPGRDGEYFTADFWWLLKSAHLIESGRYDNRDKAKPTPAAIEGPRRAPSVAETRAMMAAKEAASRG